jgi:hypothetical protein
MTERRDVTRTRIRRNAEIVVGERSASTLKCTVHNLTSTGASLTLAGTHQVPDAFELTFDRGRSRRPCRVKWRTDDGLGVSFDRPAEPSAE